MKTVALIGAKGFVGSEIADVIERKNEYSFIPIKRGDDLEGLIKKSDIVIHAANSGKRFFAKNNPEVDFIESVEKTAKIREFSRNKRLILISTISARTQLDTVYGRNRRSCELITNKDSLIVRLGPMFGEGKLIGALSNIINNETVYVSSSTRYAYVNVQYNAEKIHSFLDNDSLKGCIELGAKDSIELGELAKILESDSEFEGADDTQAPISPLKDAPSSKDVIKFAESIRSK